MACYGFMFNNTIFVAKLTFYTQSHFSHFGAVFFPVIEVMTYVAAKSLEIFAKMVAILSGYRILKETCHATPHYIKS